MVLLNLLQISREFSSSCSYIGIYFSWDNDYKLDMVTQPTFFLFSFFFLTWDNDYKLDMETQPTFFFLFLFFNNNYNTTLDQQVTQCVLNF